MFLFVILFGLSMDYHVFILSRVREYFDRGLSTEEAVARGIKSTAGVVTSAAAVMVLVFGVFVLMPIVDMKEFGIGLAGGDPDRRDDSPGRPPARDDEAPRQVELVPADVARLAPPPRARAALQSPRRSRRRVVGSKRPRRLGGGGASACRAPRDSLPTTPVEAARGARASPGRGGRRRPPAPVCSRSVCVTGSRSARKLLEASLRTSWPDVRARARRT